MEGLKISEIIKILVELKENYGDVRTRIYLNDESNFAEQVFITSHYNGNGVETVAMITD